MKGQDRKSRHKVNYLRKKYVVFVQFTFMQLQNILSYLEDYPFFLQLLAAIGIAIALATMVVGLLLLVLRTTNKRLGNQTIDRFSQRLRTPLLLFISAIILLILWSGLSPESRHAAYFSLAVSLAQTLLYIFGAWLLIRLVKVAADGIRLHYEADNNITIKERKILTQLQYIEQIVLIVVSIIAAALILLQFDNVKSLGATILTSAGVTGIIVGLAAQKSIANLLAGFQIAFTQPIRINDRISINGEVGHVEDITLTYVVLKIWDERRLIIPLQHFIDQSFENWTHTDTQLMGSSFVFTDYAFPVEALREEMLRYLSTNPNWDERVAKVQVTDLTATSMQIRLLVSAANAASLFELRCQIREHAIAFIRDSYPTFLPTARVMELPQGRVALAKGNNLNAGAQPL